MHSGQSHPNSHNVSVAIKCKTKAVDWSALMWRPIGVIKNEMDISAFSGRVAQSVGNLARKSGVLGSIPGLATYFSFSFRFFKKGSCQLLAKVC